MLIESIIGGAGRASQKVEETSALTPPAKGKSEQKSIGKVSPMLEKKREEALAWDIEDGQKEEVDEKF